MVSINLTLEDQDDRLQSLAIAHGCTAYRPQGKGNVKQYVTRLLSGEFWAIPDEQIEALQSIANRYEIESPETLLNAIASRDIGVVELAPNLQYQLSRFIAQAIAQFDFQAARSLSEFMLGLPLLPIIRGEVETYKTLAHTSWIAKVCDAANAKQPFRLGYCHAGGATESYDIYYAELVERGSPDRRRWYLDIWEPNGDRSDPIPELRHNRSLNLQRIPQGSIVPIAGEWRKGLATAKVKFDVWDNLIWAYTQYPDDEVEVVASSRHRVTRTITNSFWFQQQLGKYGENATIVAPDTLLDAAIAKAEVQLQRLKNGKLIDKFRDLPLYGTKLLIIGEGRDRGVGTFKGIVPPSDEDGTEYLSIDFPSNDKYLHENLWLLPEEVEIIEKTEENP